MRTVSTSKLALVISTLFLAAAAAQASIILVGQGVSITQISAESTPPAPTTFGAEICGAGVASLSALGTGGELNWYSDEALLNLVYTGETYSPVVTSTTTYYVTETSGTGEVSLASSVTATVLSGPSMANAGPNQVLPTLVSTVQLAGSVGNGGAGGTWSGGSGTFSPNASTLNALYTPSATEIAAGSWALTLTANANACGAESSTMSFSYSTQAGLPLSTNTSRLQLTTCLDPKTGSTDLGMQCQSATNRVMGDMLLQFDDPLHPTTVALQDFHFTAMAAYQMNFKWTSPMTVLASVTIGLIDAPVAIQDTYPHSATAVPVSADGSFTLVNVPLTVTSLGEGLSGYPPSYPIDFSSASVLPTVVGTVYITNEVATVHLDFSALGTYYNQGGTALTGYTTFKGSVDAVGATAPPRYMVWNNDAGTGNWNTSDANWNNGSAHWDNGRALDGAVFAGAGVGMVNLTQPITASSIWFSSPGYALAGSSLNLLHQCGITNDSDAVISAAIVSGALNKWGAGKLTLSGTNTYTGATSVEAGVLEYSSSTALGATSGIIMQNGAEVFFGAGLAGARVTQPMELNGVGVNGGTLHVFVPGGQMTFAGPISLLGDSRIYGQAAPSSMLNFSSPISGSHDLTFFAGGDGGDQVSFVLSGASTYSGGTWVSNYNSSALLTLSGGNNRLPASTILYLSSGAGSHADSSILDLNGNNQTLASLQDGPVIAGPRIIRNSSGILGMLTLSNASFSGTLEGNLGLVVSGPGTVTLSGANTYSGNTVIQAGGVLDVSAITGGYHRLGSALTANGTAIPETIRGPMAGVVDLGPEPIMMTYDGVHPALIISQGTLLLDGNPFTIMSVAPLPAGTYVLIQQAAGDIASTGIFPAATGTAIGHGHAGAISVSGGQVLLNVALTALPSTTSLGPGPSPQTYGNVILSASVSPSVATGTVDFQDGSTVLATVPLVDGSAAFTPVANQLPVSGSPHAIRAVYSGDASYAASASAMSPLTISPRSVQVSGAKTYDGTALAPSDGLAVDNNLDAANLALGGVAALESRDTGSQSLVASTYAAPARVRVSTGPINSSPSTSVAVTLSGTAVNGNTLVAVISTRLTSINAIRSITQVGAAWTRAASSTGTAGTTTEIWYAPNVQSAGSSVTIAASASTFIVAVIIEYRGVFTPTAVDKTATASGIGTTASTGMTSTTGYANEVWIGGVGLAGFYDTLTVTGSPAFSRIATSYSGNGNVLTANARVYALEYIASATGAASSGGTVPDSSAWSGAIATFLGVPSLTLSGIAAPNYTVSGLSGEVTVHSLPVTVAAAATGKTYDATTASSGTPDISPALMPADSATALSQAFASKNAGTVSLVPSITISDGNGGANYAVTLQDASGTIAPKPLQVTNLTAVSKTYDGLATAAAGGAAVFLAAEAPGTGTNSDYKPYTGDDVSPGGTAVETFSDKNIGLNKAVNFSGVTAVGADAGNYTVTQQGNATASITQRVVQLGGSKTYNGNTAIPAANLTISNNMDGANPGLSGSGSLSGRNAGAQTIVPSSYAAPVRVQTATGNTASAASSFTVTLAAPANGNTLVAVISTRGTSTSRVTAITQVGATWTRVAQAANSSGSTLEIWYAPNVFFAGTMATISQASSLRSAAVIMEYSGLLSAGAADQTASTTGNSTSPSTGTTSTTAQANEVWVGGIGFTNSSYTLGTPTGGFTSPTNAQSGSTSATANAKVYALEQIVSASGTAGSGGTLSAVSIWAGAMATFKAQDLMGTLALGGAAAPNYTLIGASSAVTVVPTNLTVTAAYNSKLYDGTVTAVATPTITSSSIQVGDSAPAWTERYADPNVGTGKTLTPVAAVVTDGNGGANYNVSYVTAAGDITALQIAPGGQPTNTTECAGSPAVFTASAPALVTYRWQASRDGGVTFTNISDTATNASYTEPSPTVADNGSQYQVVVSAGGGSVTSAPPALLTIHLCSGEHSIQSVVNNHDGTFTLNMLGTPGAQYYLVSSPKPEAPLSEWTPVASSTNTASSQGGTWSCVVSDPSPAHFRVVALHPGP